jgi:nucleotide-binding universal stress UspA family protein
LATQARQCIESLDAGLEVTFHKYAHRSAPGGLLQAVEELKADVLVLGSAADGTLGQVVLGSTADRLLHSSPVPLAVSPRG